MTDRPVCLYDANVLHSAQLRGFLMRLVLGEVVRAHWTEKVHDGFPIKLAPQELVEILATVESPGALIEDA